MKNTITHICFPESEKINDFDQCFYYIRHSNNNKYSFGKDNNYFTKKEMNEFVKRKKLICLKQPIILNENQTLWHKSFDLIFAADMYNPEKNREFVGKIADL